MKLNTILTFFIILITALSVDNISAQSRADIPEFLLDPAYRSSRIYEKKATTDGNRVNITFFNNGLLGGSGEVRGEWPKGSENFYIGDVSPVIALEVPVDLNNDGVADTLVKQVLTNRGPRAGQTPKPGETEFWGFEPVPGFANGSEENEKPAISTDPETWPSFWPDKPDWSDAEGNAEWNGFFGRGVINADFETYFWITDENDKFLYNTYGFQPDSTNLDRYGQGIAIKVRAMQWSQFLAQDAVFYIYEVINTSTTTYPRVATGLVVGTLSGGDGDSEDDLAFFDQANRIVYSWDSDNKGNHGQEVGYTGYAFMESPGNPYDGIDNDGDGDPLFTNVEGIPYVELGTEGTGNVFTASDFDPRVLTAGLPLILIDEATFERTIVYMPNKDTTVVSQGITYKLSLGDNLSELQEFVSGVIDQVLVTVNDGIDQNLNGIIDEDINLHYIRRQQNVLGEIVTLPSLRYKNYVGFANDVKGRTPTAADSLKHGFKNLMIDESPYDGIDNDGDWNPLTDDVGADGKAGTGDTGEGDGKPTPGEPNFGLLDVDETDQVGLTSFYYFELGGGQLLRLDRPNDVWDAMKPGFFTTNRELEQVQLPNGIDGDFVFGSGYFRLPPGQSLRFSMALVFGEDLANITNNVQTVQEIYNRNYNFAKPPDKPALQASAGDGKVVLYWDALSEQSIDPVLGQDFQGYKIYKSTDPFFLDPKRITDATGNSALLKPYVQFDLKDGIKGLWKPYADTSTRLDTVAWYVNVDLLERTRGVPFYLGDDTGLKHSFVDTVVTNGQTYYYALVAYDRGSPEFYPAENNFTVSISEDGRVIMDKNVVQVRPNAPTSGYVAGGVSTEISHNEGNATGDVFVEILNPNFVKDQSYELSFNESGFAANTFSVRSNGELVVMEENISNFESVIFDGFRFLLRNDGIRLNTDASSWKVKNSEMILMKPKEKSISNNSLWKLTATPAPYDYEVTFSDDDNFGLATITGKMGTGVFAPNLSGQAVNFKIRNVTNNYDVEFGMLNRQDNNSINPENPSRIDYLDMVFVTEIIDSVRTVVFTFEFTYKLDLKTNTYVPQGTLPAGGDVYTFRSYKSFRDNDKYTFDTHSSFTDVDQAKNDLANIRVVPNPYISAAKWERKLPPTITSGRGERRIDFIHVPAGAKIKIFTIRGELVKELRHDGGLSDGTVSWDLRTRENLEVAYGLYLYHVELKGVGEKTGKFAIIK